jgi:hypothetical protein
MGRIGEWVRAGNYGTTDDCKTPRTSYDRGNRKLWMRQQPGNGQESDSRAARFNPSPTDTGTIRFHTHSIGNLMAAPATVRPADPVRDLAARIFVELVCRNVVVTDSAAQINSNPESLAKISFKLAEAFQRVDVALKAPLAPKNQEFDMKAASLPGWDAEKSAS